MFKNEYISQDISIKTEEQLASLIKSYFERYGYTVFSEVTHDNGARADMVAQKDDVKIIIETKMTLSLSLLAQAYNWISLGSATFIVYPARKANHNIFTKEICADYGIGLIEVILDKNKKAKRINIRSSPIFNDNVERHIEVHNEQLAQVGGTKRGGYSTPFSRTVARLVEYCENNKEKEITLNSALTNIEHHYSNISSAKGVISKLIYANIIKDVELYKNSNGILCIKRD